VRRRAASCPGGAGQLSSGGGGQGRGAGAVTAEPSWVPSAPRRRDPGEVGPPSGCRRSRGCPDTGQAGRRPVRRADVRPVGQAGVRRPRVRCPGVRCHPGVRTDGPPVSAALQPRCPDRAGPWNGSVRRAVPVGRNGFDVLPWSAGGVVACLHRAGQKGWCCVGRGWLARGSTADLGHRIVGRRTGCGAASPSCRQGSWSSARVLVGWLRSTRTSRCSPVPRSCVLGRCRRGARPWG
jgi:hypothetical protein